MAMTTSKTVYRVGYQPLAAGIFVAPFPYAYRYGWDDQTAVDFCLSELDLLLKSQSAPEETAAMVIEPVLGEGGYIPAPAAFLKGLREICNHYGILLIFDEVQSGFGRTGKFFALEHSGVVPDILVMAKGLASGMPMSAIAAPLEMMERWTAGTHGGTYGGNPVAAAAAAATIEVINDEGLLENANERGQQLRDAMEEMQIRWPFMGDIRGPGLMVGLEIGVPGRGPDKDLTSRIQAICLDNNLLLLTCGTYGNVIRWIPPLMVSESQINDALLIMEEGFEEIFED
jgi:4-aminobutyrate aminotransferase